MRNLTNKSINKIHWKPLFRSHSGMNCLQANKFFVLLLFLCLTRLTLFAEDNSPNKPLAIIVDTDMGTDDVMAFLSLLKKPHLDVKAITVTGTGLAHATEGLQNVRRLLAFLKKPHIPTAAGTEKPLGGNNYFPDAWRSECDALLEGFAVADETWEGCGDAVKLLHETLSASTEKLTLLTLGPMTNLALLFRQYPEDIQKVERIHAMAGAVDVPGNLWTVEGNLVGEWNIFADPLAAYEVFQTNIPITLISLDVTKQVPLTWDFYHYVKENHRTPEAKYFLDLLNLAVPYIDHNYCFWDLLAAETLADPTLAEYEERKIVVVTEKGPNEGRTSSSEMGRVVQLAKKTSYEQFIKNYFETINN